MPNVPGDGNPAAGVTAGPASPEAPGPLQLERAWHGLMYTMAGKKGAQVTRMQTINSVTRHIRAQMKGR